METTLDCSEQNRSLFLKQHPDYAECLSKKTPGKWRRKNSNLVREDQGKSYWLYAEDRELEVSQWVIHQDLSYPTLLVYGVGLGAHYLGLLPWLRGDPKRKVIFVEDDLDIMQNFLTTPLATQLLQDEQADLFVVDLLFGVKTFEEIANKMVVQHVHFCAIEFYEKYYQKQFSMIHYQILFFKEMIEFSLSECLTKGEWYFKHFYLNHMKVDQSFQGVKLFEQFKGVPAIICGAGPSLEKNIHLLGDLQEKALIFAGGSGMNVLNAHGIQPHFGFGVDPFDPQFTRMLMQTAFETPYFYLDRLHHRAFDLIQGPRIYLSAQGGYTVGDWYDRELNMECPKIEEGCNVINLSTVVAEKLGCNPIIFVGLDMAYTEGKSYAPGITTHAIHSTKTDRTTRRLTEEIILRPDIDGKQIQTLWKWEMESNWYSLFSRLYPDVKLINATEGGIGMPTVPNVSLQEVIETQLTKQMPLNDWIHATLQQAALPEQVTSEKLRDLTKNLLDSFEECFKVISQTPIKKEDDYSHLIKKLYKNLAYEQVMKQLHHKFRDYLLMTNQKQEKLKRYQQEREYLLGVLQVNLFAIKKALFQYDVGASVEKHNAHIPFEKESLPIPEGVEKREKRGKWLEEWYEKGGVKHGPYHLNTKEGKLLVEKNYLDGLLDGPAYHYSLNSKLLSATFYKKGKLHGEQLVFFPNGQLKSRIPYSEGNLEGTIELFFINGHPHRVLSFRNGKRHGSDVLFTPASLQLMEAHYQDDHPVGMAREWYEDGALCKEFIYSDSGKLLDQRAWTPQGKPISEKQLDYFDAVTRSTEDLTSSFSHLYDSLADLAQPNLNQDLAELNADLEKLQAVSQKLTKASGKDSDDEQLWKTPETQKAVQKQIETLTSQLGQAFGTIQKHINSMKKDIKNE